MSLPFFTTLRQLVPASVVDIIAKTSVQEVFQHHPAIRTIHPFAKAQVNGWWGLCRYGQTLRQSGPYNVFITLPTSFSAALIGRGVGSRIRIGYPAEARAWLLTHRPHPPQGIHRAYVYRHLLTALSPQPLPDSIDSLRFPFSDAERQTTLLPRSDPGTYIVFNVNAEAQSRRLPLAKWIALGQRLLAHDTLNARLVFVGSSAERPRVAEVLHALSPSDRLLDFSGKTTIRELAVLLRDADAVVTNDSGPMHLANAVGAPLLTWIGAADPVETEPFNPDKTIVINKQLPCSPCVKNVCRFPTVRCLEQITVDEIYAHLLTLLGHG